MATITPAVVMNAATTSTTSAAQDSKKRVVLYNPDIDYSAPLQQQINPELIGSHPHAALHHQQYISTSNNVVCNKNNSNVKNRSQQDQQQLKPQQQQQHQQMLLAQLQQQQQQHQRSSTYISAPMSMQQQLASLMVNQQQQQQQQQQQPQIATTAHKLNESQNFNPNNTLLHELNVIKMWQQQQQTITQIPQLLNGLLLVDSDTENIHSNNSNIPDQKNTLDSSINNLLNGNAKVGSINNNTSNNKIWSNMQQQLQYTSKYNNNNNNNNDKEISNLWGCVSSSTTSSSASTCSSSSGSSSSCSSSSSSSSSSGCSSGGSSSLSPTSSTPSFNNALPTTLLISHATTSVKNIQDGKETVWSQTISPTSSLHRESVSTNCDIGVANIDNNHAIYKNNNNQQQPSGGIGGSTNLWSIDGLNQSFFTINNNDNNCNGANIINNKDTLSQFANISNIWQLPSVSYTSNVDVNNTDLYTDLWNSSMLLNNSKNNEINSTQLSSDNNICSNMSAAVTHGEQNILDPAGIWRLDAGTYNINNSKNEEIVDLFGKQQQQSPIQQQLQQQKELSLFSDVQDIQY